MKAEKGITLVALVITIIVLLILAMVSISIISQHDIINYANNAVTGYNEAQAEENKALENAVNAMKNYENPKASE